MFDMGPQIQKFSLICCFFTWRRASESLRQFFLHVTLKSATTNFVFHIFNLKQNVLLSLFQSQKKNKKEKLKKPCCPFLGARIKFKKQIFPKFSFFGNCSLMYNVHVRKIFTYFKKIYSFLRSLCFKKNVYIDDFLELNSQKNSNVSFFENR